MERSCGLFKLTHTTKKPYHNVEKIAMIMMKKKKENEDEERKKRRRNGGFPPERPHTYPSSRRQFLLESYQLFGKNEQKRTEMSHLREIEISPR
jgi:hypothetical protein